ncbi:hypothetical protein BTR22_19120 [Alkalihalophilus pseudofirmus]|uniref:DUF3954 domain-containing protein n=1 Tax=Alkalihalophilus pseudofirmus TaxID=79885 RepID=UPI000951083C|nr:hypothetical protein BTR22_19120 [Alkalihalophilus pseudofirmus]
MDIVANGEEVKISLESNGTYVVSNGSFTKVDAPITGFGKQVITWNDGRPVRQEVTCGSLIK